MTSRHLADSLKLSDLIDWSGAAAVVNSHDGIAHDVTAKEIVRKRGRLRLENADATPALISRRKLLKMGHPSRGSGADSERVAMAAYHIIPKRSRSLSFYNLHTGESLKTTYFAKGEYISGALAGNQLHPARLA